MIPRQLLPRKPPSGLSRPNLRPRAAPLSTGAPSKPTMRTRATQILDRVPRVFQPYTSRLREAPMSHVVSFVVLHEITAVVPLLGLAGLFHWGGWLPPLFSESAYLAPGVERFGRYFRRKGWFGLGEDETEVEGGPGYTSTTRTSTSISTEDGQEQAHGEGQKWNLDSPGMRVVVEFAAAYAVTKALLPLRLMLSVWATPWFARVIVGRVWSGVLGLKRAGKGKTAVGAAEKISAMGTGAVGKAAKEVEKNISKT